MSLPTAEPKSTVSPSRTDRAWLEAHWMPFTANRSFKADPRMIVEAKGAYFTDADGRKVFDSLSGLWCAGLGHGRPEITEAVSRQMAKLDYSPAFQFGHPSSFELANKLKDLTPAGLDYVFFTGSGSEAADTSLKMARAYWRAKGQATKTRLIGREKGYHGVNFGGISVGGIGGNRKVFGQAVEADHLPHTMLASNAFSRGMPEQGADLAGRLLDLIALHDASNIAAVIVEPFSGSAGVIVPPQGYLQKLREICTAHDILLIFDEVVTGFGRAGAWTGADAFGVVPDIMNVAKQITNGAQPLGAVIAKKDTLSDSRLVAQRLGQHQRILCASPAYVERHGAPETPAQLAAHDCLEFQGFASFPNWRLSDGSRSETVTARGAMRSNDNSALLEAARVGIGILGAGEWLVTRDIAAGTLVRVLPDWAFDVDGGIYLVRPSAQHAPARTDAFLGWMREQFRHHMPWCHD